MRSRILSAADREIRLGIWKIHILFHASKRDVWGIWLLEELAEHGHHLSPGTLYPALARMERNGWLEPKGNAAHARARQVFRTTGEGRRLLRTLRREVKELYAEVVLGREPDHDGAERSGQSKRVQATGARREVGSAARHGQTRRKRNEP
jgi:DNA-binding PadR family transcriptional regulator